MQRIIEHLLQDSKFPRKIHLIFLGSIINSKNFHGNLESCNKCSIRLCTKLFHAYIKCNFSIKLTHKQTQCVVPKNIHTPPHGKFFFVLHPPLPPKKFQFKLHTLPLKFWLFGSPLPLGISDDLPWGRYGFFLGLRNSLATCEVDFLNLG